jgi:hypothetical protein
MVTLGLAAACMLPAKDRSGLEGVWNVSVTVTDCQGNVVRTVTSLQLFHPDGSVTETSNLSSRGMSEGVWKPIGNGTFNAAYWFFRYDPPIGPFASFATVTENITLDSDNQHFSSTGTVVDLESNGATVKGCFTHAATRLADLPTDDLR